MGDPAPDFLESRVEFLRRALAGIHDSQRGLGSHLHDSIGIATDSYTSDDINSPQVTCVLRKSFHELERVQVPYIQSTSGDTAIKERSINRKGKNGVTIVELCDLHGNSVRMLSQTPKLGGTVSGTGDKRLFRRGGLDETSDEQHGVHVTMVGEQFMMIPFKCHGFTGRLGERGDIVMAGIWPRSALAIRTLGVKESMGPLRWMYRRSMMHCGIHIREITPL